MNRDDLRGGAAAGILAATATTGTLIAIGSRTSSAARPFNVIASHLLGRSSADAWGFVAGTTIPGIAVHVGLTSLLGIVVAAIVRRKLAPLWITAISASVLCALVSVGVARRGGSSLAQLLTLGDLLVFYITLAVSLAIGMRFAITPRDSNDARRMEPM